MPSNLYVSMRGRLREEPGHGPRLVTFVNLASYLRLRHWSDLVDNFDEIFVDGFLLAWLLRLAGIKVRRRSFDGTSLGRDVLQRCAVEGVPIVLIGGESGVARRAADRLQDQFPGLIVIQALSGFFDDEAHRTRVLCEIIALRPSIVIAGLGAVRQELFLYDLWRRGWRGEGFTCGGFLHQTSERGVDYYPRWVNNLNMRWLFRMVDEPRLVPRYVFSYPYGALMVIFDILRSRRGAS